MSIDEIQREAESIFDEYEANFAGKPRATRELDRLDGLIDRLEALVERAKGKLNGGRNEELLSTIEQATENLEIYRRERRAIEEVQAGGEAPVRASRLATWANAEFHRYRRHFGGRSRATRDLELLNEIISELQGVDDEMSEIEESEEVEGLSEDIRTVRENLEQYREEREKIVTARADGSAEERASVLAVAANEQFAIYTDLFAGKNRVTRRPKLLRRVIRSLENLARKMREIEEESGGAVEQNAENLEIVEENLEMYREEIEAIEEVRGDLDPEDLAGQLGGAANEVFQEYRSEYAGEDRSTRDLDKLGRLCDELYHLGRQMRAIDREHGLEMNSENLSIVLENLSLYQREYNAISDARGSNAIESR